MSKCSKWCPNGCGKSVIYTHYRREGYSCVRCNKNFSTEEILETNVIRTKKGVLR